MTTVSRERDKQHSFDIHVVELNRSINVCVLTTITHYMYINHLLLLLFRVMQP
jgi:hypothetical protein